MDNYQKYKSSSELKALAKEHMFGKYGTAIGALIIVSMITMFATLFATMFVDTSTLLGVLLEFLISFVISVLTGLFTSGERYFYLKISCGQPVTVSDVFYGFKLFPNKAVSMQLYLSALIYISMLPMTLVSYLMTLQPKNSYLMLLYSLTMLFYGIVTVIVSLVYGQTFFLLHDFPNYSAKELLAMSRRLMKGSKGRLFYISASFIPLMLLGLLSCGIAYLWIIPYMNATSTEFYLDLIRNNH